MIDKYLETTIEKLVHGGQGMGVIDSGIKSFVWGVLPGERVIFKVAKKRADYVEGVVSEILEPSVDRVSPKDEAYLSTSPWQIILEKSEDNFKKEILQEAMVRAGVDLQGPVVFDPTTSFWHYRNKMEYSFYGDDDGLHLALYNRGTHQKNIINGSSIARSEIDAVAVKLRDILHTRNIRAGDLKSVILRCNQKGEVVAALFVKDKHFPKFEELGTICKGVVVVYSNPKSPASVRTKDLYSYGNVFLSEDVAGNSIYYDVFSFFQVNVPVFERVLNEIESFTGGLPVIDMYSGVGAIGVSLSSTDTLIESDELNIVWAQKNIGEKPGIKVVHARSEQALEYIDGSHIVVVDPPRAGLHIELVEKICGAKPPKVIYLSCNPSTQARDIAKLQTDYKVESIKGYNFFPRTPHIESLALLVRH